MGTLYGFILMIFMALLLLAAMKTRKRIIEQTLQEMAEKENSFSLLMSLGDKEASVTKIIINPKLKENVSLQDFTTEDLGTFTFSMNGCKVVKSYLSNIDGIEVPQEEANHISIELDPPYKGFDLASCKIGHEKFFQEASFNDFFCPEADCFSPFKTGTSIQAAYCLPQVEDLTSYEKYPVNVFIAKANTQANGLYYELIKSGGAKIAREKAYGLFLQANEENAGQKAFDTIIKSFLKKTKAADEKQVNIIFQD